MATIQGYYRWVWRYVPDLNGDRYAASPFYGKRQKWISAKIGVVTQILVKCMGDLVWINIDPADILTPPNGAMKGAA